MKTFRNINFKKRNYECKNVVACVAEVAPTSAGTWIECDASILDGLTQLHIINGRTYWGYM